MIGRPILRAEEAVSDNILLKEIMCGDEAAAARHCLDVKYPVINQNSETADRKRMC